jgi:hypothetical protein
MDQAGQTYAKLAGVLILISVIAGAIGEVYIPGKLIVASDAAATTQNIVGSMLEFRASFAMYLVEAVCDVSLTLVFYVLLTPVSRNIALLAAFFGLQATATFAVAEFFYFAPSLLMSGHGFLSTLPIDERNAFTMLSLSLYGYGASIFVVFYGIVWVLRGYLIFRSGFFPRILGALLVVGGLGFLIKNFILVLVPHYNSGIWLLPMAIAILALAFWCLVKGVDPKKWNASGEF